MDGLFISYRRQDASGHAGRLRDHLRARFGELVFQDVEDIADGEIFEDVLDRALASCRVGLVVIGPRWLDAVDATGQRRLDAPDDWVRTEIRQLLERGIRVIPVLVGGARMPTPDLLPDDLKPLAKRQARELRDASWDGDVAALIKRLDEALGTAAPPPAAPAASPRRAWVAGAALLVLIAAAGSAFWWRGGSGGAASSSSAASQSESPASTASVAGVASSPPADPTLAAAIALGLPGTRWRMEDFSGMEPEPGTPKTFEFVVRDGAVLLQPTGKAAQSPMLAKQIHGRAITFLPQRSDGKPFEFMYVFELAADGSKLEHCQTVAVADLAGQGPCQWRYHRASAGAPSTAAVPLPTPVGCGPSMPSEADPACVAAARAAGLLGEWTGADGKTAYTLAAVGDAVQLRSPALRAEKQWRLLLRQVQEGRVSFAWAGFGNRAGAFDAQMWVEYDLVSVGGAKRLVKCRAITQLSTRQEAVDCSDVPAFLAQRAGGG